MGWSIDVNHVVKMERLPEGLRFPDDLQPKIDYDAAKKRLTWRGFMSKRDFDRLIELSDNWAYRRQIEELFRLSVETPSNKGSSSSAGSANPASKSRFGFSFFRWRS